MRILFILILALILLPAGYAAAKAKQHNHPMHEPIVSFLPSIKPIVTDYAVYVGGVHLVDTQFLFSETGNRYQIKAKAVMHGFWNRFVSWETDLWSEGVIDGDHFEPEMHKNITTFKNVPKTFLMRFDTQHNITTVYDPPETPNDTQENVTPEQRRGALDPLSSPLQLLGNLAFSGNCNATAPVFDGKRRFDLIAEDKGTANTDPDDYGIYKGNARRCDVAFQMIAGQWKDRERSMFWQTTHGEKGRREPFQIWLAKVSPELPEMAVRAESSSVWGRIVVHMTGWHYATADEIRDAVMPK